MADPKQKRQQSDAEQIEQLNMLASAYMGAATFKPGDLVLVRPETLPAHLRPRDVRQIAVVLDTVPSLREFAGEKSISPGQGLLLASTDHRGEWEMSWHQAWQYVLAPPDLIASFAGHTSH